MAMQFFKLDVKNKPLKKGSPNKRSIIKVLQQTGKDVNIKRDLGRKARLPGKRISKTGKIYWESRKNRSDVAGQSL